METNGYLAGELTKAGKWIIENETIYYLRSSKFGGLFMGLGALGGALSSANKEKAAVTIPLCDITDVCFVKFRLNKKCLQITTKDNEYKIILDKPDEWLNYIKSAIK